MHAAVDREAREVDIEFARFGFVENSDDEDGLLEFIGLGPQFLEATRRVDQVGHPL